MKSSIALILCLFALSCTSSPKYPVGGAMTRPDGSRPPAPSYTNEPSVWTGGGQ
jgi:hypothetical protein